MKRSTMRPAGYVDGGSERELSMQPMTADAIIVEQQEAAVPQNNVIAEEQPTEDKQEESKAEVKPAEVKPVE